MISKDEQRHDALVMPIETLPLPSFDRLDELLIYNPEDGSLRWRINWGPMKSGDAAGSISTNKHGRQDYKIQIDSKLYLSSRVIWMLHFHEDPGCLTIDHVDMNPLNNRISNLRLATAHEQAMNRRCTSSTTATRYTGLSMRSRKNDHRRPQWCGQIRVAGHRYSFGSASVNTINDPAPQWLIDRASRLYVMRDDPDITDDTLIDLIKGLKRMPPVTTAAE